MQSQLKTDVESKSMLGKRVRPSAHPKGKEDIKSKLEASMATTTSVSSMSDIKYQ